MDNNQIKTARRIFLDIIKNIINPSSETVLDGEIDGAFQKIICKMAYVHDLAHLLSSESVKKDVLTNPTEKAFVNKQQIMSIYRYERLNFDYQEIKETFIKEKIPFVPLKGLIIRSLYPEPWMRTSCDIDVLVKKEDLNRAVEALKKNNKFVQYGKVNYHDISLFSPSNVHLELHFSIKENIECIDKLLDKVWDYCENTAENPFEFKETNEFFVFHTLAHMLYHFKAGGCGIRPFMDLYLLHKNFELDLEKLESMIKECGITKFYENVKLLSEVWFEDKEHTDLTLSMEDYVFSGGVYGSKENDLAVKKNKVNRKSYIFNRIFSPYDVIKNRYPILQKHKWLTPFYQVRRWIESLFKNKAKQLKTEIQIYDNVDQTKKEKVEKMFSGLDIKI